ncbi:MAG: hypothetical protein AB1589_29755 [Cyanobacteriota bacterium]
MSIGLLPEKMAPLTGGVGVSAIALRCPIEAIAPTRCLKAQESVGAVIDNGDVENPGETSHRHRLGVMSSETKIA